MASSAPAQPQQPPIAMLTEAEAAANDTRAVLSLPAAELVQSMSRIAQRLFHHIDPAAAVAAADASASASERRQQAKRKRSADETALLGTEHEAAARSRWKLHHRDEAEEAREVAQRSATPLSSFLSSAASSAHFHRFASQPAASASLPRFLTALDSLRSMARAQTQRLRGASSPLLDRLSFSHQSLSQLSQQHSSLARTLRLCRDELRAEAEYNRAAASGELHFLHVHRSLQRLRHQLRLVSEEEQETSDRAALSSSQAASAEEEEAETVVHVASAGVASCFVIEIKLRRRERSAEERSVEWQARRKDAAAVGAALPARPLHDCVVSVKADFLQGDAELHDPQIDCELYALLASCRFAALQNALSHALSIEALADRYPQLELYSRRSEVVAAFSECGERSKLPCVLSSGIDGPQLAFHHLHTHSDGEQTEEQLHALTPHLFFSTPSTRRSFASHPLHSFTHSLTYIGMEEVPQVDSASRLLAASSTSPASPSPTFAYLLSLTPSVVVPLSTLRLIARSAAGDSNRSHLQSHSSSQPQPLQSSMCYHDFIARTSSASASRLSARVSVASTALRFTLANDAPLIEDACSLSYISLASLRALPGIVHTLRQHIAFNQLYASCFRQPRPARFATAAGADSAAVADSAVLEATVAVEVTAFPPHTLRLRIAHPGTAAQFISLDIRLAAGEPHEPCSHLPLQTAATLPSSPVSCFDCHVWSVQLDRSFDSAAPCSDTLALHALSLTHSVPALVHAVVSRAKQRAHSTSNGHTAG